MSVTIYGASDDLIEVEGDVPGCDEYSAESATFTISGPDGMVRVRAQYADPGIWEIGVGQVDEDINVLPVAITSKGYTCVAVVQGATLVVREA